MGIFIEINIQRVFIARGRLTAARYHIAMEPCVFRIEGSVQQYADGTQIQPKTFAYPTPETPQQIIAMFNAGTIYLPPEIVLRDLEPHEKVKG